MEFSIEIDNVVFKGIKIIGNRVEVDTVKPTIVFLHDSLGCVDLWRDFPNKISEATGSNVVVYDRQGYGNSSAFTSLKRTNSYLEIEADVLHDLLQKLQLDNVILFGHSDGGSIALIAAAKYPETIKGIITEGAHVFVEEITLNGIRKAVEDYQFTNLKDKLAKYHGNKVEAIFKAWTETWLHDDFRDWNIEHFLKRITCPCLIIQGENDEFGSEKQVDAIINQVNGVTIKHMISNIGHTPHKETAEKTLAATIDFIRKF